MKRKEGEKYYLPFYESYFIAVKRIPSREWRCFYYDMLADYWFEGKEPEFDAMPPELAMAIATAFPPIKASMDKSQYHKANSAKGGRNGKEVSRNVGNTHAAKKDKINSESIVNQYHKDKDNDNDNDNDNSNDKGEGENSGSLSLTSQVEEMKPSKKHKRAREFWEAVRKVYPSHRRRAPSERVLKYIEGEKLWERTEEIVATVLKFTAEDSQWKKGFIPAMGKFIEEERWKNEPEPEPAPEVRIIQTIHTSKPPESKVDLSNGEDLPL